MMSYHNIFNGENVNEVWQEIYNQLISQDKLPQESRIGLTQEILHAFITIENPRQRWVTSRTPAINPAFAIAEVVWIINGRKDSKFLNFWNSQLPNFAGRGVEYHGAYGHRLRKNFHIDQLNDAYLALKNNPKSRQVVLQIWDPQRDFPAKSGKAVSKDIPCNIVAMLKVRDKKLEWQQIMRSNDIILGLPYNFIQFTTLQEVLAGWLNLELGSYNHLSDSLHLYLQNKNDYNNEPIDPAKNVDDLRLSKDKSEIVFKEFASKIDYLIDNDFSEKDLLQIAEWDNVPPSYRNLLLLICAEAARKKGLSNISANFIEKCDNLALTQYWELWLKRFSNN